MPTYVTPAGLVIPTVEELTASFAADQRSGIDPNLDTDPDSPMGQMNGIVANAVREVFEIAAVAFNANDPDQAEGSLLVGLCKLTGTTPGPATASKLTGAFGALCNLNGGAFLPSGSQAGIPGTSIVFASVASFTAPAGPAANYRIDFVCTVLGPTVCDSGQLTQIVTPQAGWNSVTNDFDAILGTNADTDPQLRVRRETELRAKGTATAETVREALLAITLSDNSQPVTQCVVFENDQDYTDANGLPPHSLRALVFDGLSPAVPNDTIAQTIWNTKGGGIQLTGNTFGTATDKLNVSRTVPFSRPTISQIDFLCTLTLTNPNQTAAQYLAVVQQTIIAEFAIKVKMGSVIRVRHYEGKVTDIPGIDDCVIQVKYHTSMTWLPPDTNLALGTFEMGFTNTSGISVQ